MTEDEKTVLERLTIRVDSDVIDMLDVIAREEQRFNSRSDVIRAAIGDFIDTRGRYASRIIADIPTKDLDALHCFVNTGVVHSVSEGVRAAVAEWIEIKSKELRARIKLLRKLKAQEFDTRLSQSRLQ